MEKNPDSGSGINIPILFLRTWYQIFGLKILNFFDSDPDPGSCQPWIRDGKSRIRDPGS
jgi:hypothetical protein